MPRRNVVRRPYGGRRTVMTTQQSGAQRPYGRDACLCRTSIDGRQNHGAIRAHPSNIGLRRGDNAIAIAGCGRILSHDGIRSVSGLHFHESESFTVALVPRALRFACVHIRPVVQIRSEYRIAIGHVFTRVEHMRMPHSVDQKPRHQPFRLVVRGDQEQRLVSEFD